MTMRRKFGNCFLAMVLGTIIPAAGHAQQSRTAITPQRIAGAMAEAGWRVSTGQIKLLSQVTAIAGDAWLQVVQVTHWQEDKLKVELRCRDPRACLPFYVLVTEDRTAGKSGPTLPADTDSEAKQPPLPLETTAEKPLMRSGDPAVLTFADKGLSITMPVVCLQSGHRGQMIRVASADHKRFYKAEIVGPGLLKAAAL
jgi:hypothetical protein